MVRAASGAAWLRDDGVGLLLHRIQFGATPWSGDPDAKKADIKAAIDYFQTVDGVDADRIGACGICGSGAYMAYEIKDDPRVKTFVGVVPFTLMDTVHTMSKEEAEAGKKRWEASGEAPGAWDLIETAVKAPRTTSSGTAARPRTMSIPSRGRRCTGGTSTRSPSPTRSRSRRSSSLVRTPSPALAMRKMFRNLGSEVKPTCTSHRAARTSPCTTRRPWSPKTSRSPRLFLASNL